MEYESWCVSEKINLDILYGINSCLKWSEIKAKKVRKVFTSNSINPVDLPIYLVE